MNPMKRAVVIGTGMMGPGIAATVALGGVDVHILSRTEDAAASGVARARQQIALLIEHGLAPENRHGEIQGGIDMNDVVPTADLVIESAPEDMLLKQTLFAALDKLAAPSSVLASNTSGLSITEIASRCQHPERVVTAHFWNPPHLMPLVEIVRGTRTDPSVADDLAVFLRRCGKTPVVIQKDRPGQLGNRLQMALLREACHIVEEGIATVEDVDLAAKSGFGLRLPVYGIFEHQDAVGLDMGLGILDYIARDLASEKRAPDIYRERVAQGKLGAKTGEGFYQWPDGGMDAVKRRRDAFVLDFVKRSRPAVD